MTMTEEELERRARNLCEMRGIVPEERMRYRKTDIFRPAWKGAAEELRAWDQCRRVMEESLPERELQEGDRVRSLSSEQAGVILAFATTRRGDRIAVVELDSGTRITPEVEWLERTS